MTRTVSEICQNQIKLSRLKSICTEACENADLGSFGAYFRAVEQLGDVTYFDIDFDFDGADYDDRYLSLIDDLLAIARRVMGGRVIVVARSSPQYFGDTEDSIKSEAAND